MIMTMENDHHSNNTYDDLAEQYKKKLLRWWLCSNKHFFFALRTTLEKIIIIIFFCVLRKKESCHVVKNNGNNDDANMTHKINQWYPYQLKWGFFKKIFTDNMIISGEMEKTTLNCQKKSFWCLFPEKTKDRFFNPP